MALWTVAFLVAIAWAAVSADSATYPEEARSRSVSRIVSGWDATEGQFPYQLSLRMVSTTGSISNCGGSIIHPEWGMTAAHCTARQTTVIVRAGAVSLSRPELVFETREWYNHPLYDDYMSHTVQPNDISLLKFGRILSFSDRIQPVRLQRAVDMNRNYDGVRLVASGWGRTWTHGESPEILQWVYLRGDTNKYCEYVFNHLTVKPSTICASAYNVSSQSTCNGDSGGPLTLLEEDGKVTLVGVASFVSGIGCHVGRPAAFIRPGHYHEWFTLVTGINFDWEFAPEVEVPGSNEAGGESDGHIGQSNGHIDDKREGDAEEKVLVANAGIRM